MGGEQGSLVPACRARLSSGSEGRTDTELLTYVITKNMADRDFFMRKGIGWALRDYSKTNSAWVRGFVAAHRDALSPLSLKEASKYL